VLESRHIVGYLQDVIQWNARGFLDLKEQEIRQGRLLSYPYLVIKVKARKI
jgi:hypothetical protein